jgi:hypothetical protein
MSQSPTLAITSDLSSLKAGQTAAITFTFSADPGASFSWDGSAGDITVSGGTLSALSGSGVVRFAIFTPDDGVNNGTASISVAAGAYTDVDGNGGEAAPSPSVTFDTLAPTQTFGGLWFSADTGASATDFITRTAAQTISATLSSALNAGDVVYGSLDNGASWTDLTSLVSGTAMAWSGVTLSGSDTLMLKVSDAAGNDGPVLSQAYVLDTTPPTQTIGGLSLSADTGASSTDFITRTAAQTISATLSSPLSAGDVVYGSLDNGASWVNLTSKVSGTTLAWAGVTLSQSDTLRLKVSDAAGNDGSVSSQAYVLDVSAPSAPSTPDMTAGSDSGASSTDNVTNRSTPTFTGTAEAGAIVTLYDSDGTSVLGNAVASGGTWTISSAALSPGAHTLTAKAVDAAGNVSAASSGLTVVVDDTAPTLAITSSAAALKSGETATITFTFSEDPGATFTWDGSSGDVSVSGGTLSAISGSGLIRTATFTPTAGTNNGTASITVASGSYVDLAGNAGGAGTTPSLTFDTLAPTLAIASNAATLKAGETATITFTFSEDPGASFSWDGSSGDVSVSGGTLSAISGSGLTRTATFTPTPGANIGAASITVAAGTYADAAGNSGGAGVTPALTFDTLAPSAPSTPDMTAGSDSGAVNTDNITRILTPTFTGTAEAGATVRLYDTDGTTVLGSGVATGGTWSITTSPLGDGVHTITAKATDAVGNVSSASTGLAVTIDASTPVAPGAPLLSPASDTGALGDNSTLTTAPTITGTAGANALVKLYDGATLLGAATADGTGAWSIVSTALATGLHTLTATQTNLAGTTSAASAPLSLTIETAPEEEPPVVTPPVVTPPSPVAVIQAANLATGVDFSAKGLSPTVTLADGTVVASWVHQIAQQVLQLQAQYSAGQVTASQAKEGVVQLAFPTKGMVIEVYAFFTGAPPTAAGLTYLIDSPTNPHDLTDAAHAAFNLVNRYINFAVNLGSVGDGRAAFQAAYGALTFEQTVAKAYEAILGEQRAAAAGYDPAAGQAYLISQQSYFRAVGGSDLGAKAAAVGALLSIAAETHLGPYYQQAHDAISAEIQLVGGSSSLFG